MTDGRRSALNLLDVAIEALDSEDEPWTVHLEVEVEGRLDEARLHAAVVTATERHPLARARLASTRSHWEIDEAPALDALDVVCSDGPDHAAVRDAFLSRRVPLEQAPPLRVLLLRRGDGETLILSASHVAFDGVGALRLLRSISRAYAGADDPLPDLDPLDARELTAHHSARDLRDRAGRAVENLRTLARAVRGAPARIAAEGAVDAPGYVIVLRALGHDQVESLQSRRLVPGASVNDALLAALHLTIGRWNEEHGQACGRVSVMMPANLRPSDRWLEVPGNLSAMVDVSTSATDRTDPVSALHAVAAETARLKGDTRTAAILDVLALGSGLPVPARQRLSGVVTHNDRFRHTAVLSNLGVVTEPISFGPGLAGSSLWFTPPASMPLGVAIGAATHGGTLFLAFRCCRALLDHAGAERFADLYLDQLQCYIALGT